MLTVKQPLRGIPALPSRRNLRNRHVLPRATKGDSQSNTDDKPKKSDRVTIKSKGVLEDRETFTSFLKEVRLFARTTLSVNPCIGQAK